MGTSGIRLVGIDVDVRVDGADAPAAAVAGEVLAFLSSHATQRPPREQAVPAITVTLTSHAHAVALPPGGAEGFARAGETVHVRRSSSEFFTLRATRVVEQAGVGVVEHFSCHRSGTRLRIDPRRRLVEAVVTAASALDVVEVVRDLVLKLAENAGAVPLHATAAVRDGRAVLVAGGKGSGKTTVLLELVERYGWAILAGDRSLLLDDGEAAGARVAGWPDYPHLGAVTVARHPGLAAIAGLAEGFTPDPARAFSPADKLPLDPQAFRRRFPTAQPGVRLPVAAVLYPRIGPGPTRVERVPAVAGQGLLASVVESAFAGAHSGWTTFVADDRARHAEARRRLVDAVAQAPAWTVTGEGALAGGVLPRLFPAA